MKLRREWLPVLGQVAVSLALSRVLNWMDAVIMEPKLLWGKGKVLLLLGAVLFTGIGAALCLSARLIPGAGDGIVEAISRRFGVELGLTKNLFDLFCMAVTFVLGLVTGHFMCALGIGTLVGVVGVGRVMEVFDRLFQKRLEPLMGLEE